MSIKIKIQGINQVNRLLNSKRRQLSGTKSVLVGYGDPDPLNSTGHKYAIYVHEDLEAKHETGQAKFLEEAPYSVDELAEVVSQSLKEGHQLIDGLEKAGRLVLERSQPLVPVETGDLKESGFVRREDSEG